MHHRAMSLLATMTLPMLMGCAEVGDEKFSCPVPAGAKQVVTETPPKRDDKQLLADPQYYSNMLQHGSNDDLRALIFRADSAENYRGVDTSLLQMVKGNLERRIGAGCPDVPSYDPQNHYIVQPIMGNMVK